MEKVLVLILGAMAAHISLAAASCRIGLKPTDTYKELSEIIRCLDARLKALEAGGATGAVQTAGAAAAKPAPSGAQEVGGVRFELERCRKISGNRGTNIVCPVFITSLGEDRVLSFFEFWNKSSITDNLGVTYSWGGFKDIGRTNFQFDGSNLFVADVRTQIDMRFSSEESVPAKSLSKVTIILNDGKIVAVFRNIPLH